MTPPRRSFEHRLSLGLFACCLVLNLAVSSVGLWNTPREIHEFRQVQTALTARSIQETGWSLAYPTPLFGPPWSAPMEFPLYQVIVATVAKLTGLALEPTGRLIALGFLYLALPACFGLAGLLGLAPPRRWLLLALILVSPVYLYYSRTFLIESTALCAAVWFLYSYLRALAPGKNRWLAAAVLIGIVAALAKVTTLMVFLVVAAGATLWLMAAQWRQAPDRWAALRCTVLRALAATVPAVAIGSAWVRYSDTIKVSNPLSAFLASGPMAAFNFGSLAQRGSLEFWTRILHHTTTSVVGPFTLTVAIVFGLLLARGRRPTLLLISGFLTGPLVLANLYFVHDYYFYANGLFLLAFVALAWDQLLEAPGFSPPAKWSVILLSLALQFVAFLQAYFPVQRDPRQALPPELGGVLAAATEPGDILLVAGLDWDAQVAYYSHRRAIMLTDVNSTKSAALDEVLRRLPADSVTALVVTGKMRQYPAFFNPLLARLKLHPSAVVVSSDTLIYLAERHCAAARQRLALLPLELYHLTEVDEGLGGVPRSRYPVAQLEEPGIVAMMTPAPIAIIHPFEPGTLTLDSQTVFSAHAPTDLIFAVPPGAKVAVAEFGIMPDAYTGKNATEGVEFRVMLVAPDGQRRTLHSVYLSPSRVPADRGGQTLRVALPAGARGQLWFRTLPGPTGSIACAWAYWTRIHLE